MSKPTAQQNPLRLHAEKDAERQVVVHPSDDDVFVFTGKQAIRACQLSISIEVWLNELEGMLEEVRRWASERADAVSDSYAVPRDARIVLFVVPTSSKFNFDLSDELVELHSRLIKSFNIGMIEILQIPKAEIERFLDPGLAKHIYGGPTEPHPTVEA